MMTLKMTNNKRILTPIVVYKDLMRLEICNKTKKEKTLFQILNLNSNKP